ncbi:hypothetical protein GE061_007467 [Apolygus lucorum]|uniref:Peptidase S1 domain-containing protein n=1 Tax=Apolygus lucorum TaxID=248454 RepID=A0A8S9WTI7_APOLU|nr:hypothetical protein GE061_007467 [Apolygus lucorum]
MTVSMLWWLIIFSVSRSSSFDLRSLTDRTKRIIYGKPINENTDYNSPKYVVSIHYAYNCNKLCQRSPVFHICSGSLLTPNLVQTACHCVARFGSVMEGFQDPVIINVWEHLYVIYVGAKVSGEPQSMARVYIHHQKCAAWGLNRLIFHDYGLIVLRTPLDSSKVAFAPLYTVKTLTTMWTKMTTKQIVCLNVGFGAFRMNGNVTDPTPSTILRHGWLRMWDYLSCYSEMSLPNSYQKHRFNYSEVATWFCSSNLSNRRDRPGVGDSGGPVTCDNEYVGLHHMSITRATTGDYRFSTSMSTAFTAYENSADFRNSLIVFVKLFDHYGPEDSLTTSVSHQ